MLKVYQFPISHYCEKVRWALDYKGLPYRCINLLPGLHVRKTRALAQHSSVPILQDGKHCVQGSAAIITYLDEKYPDRSLTPHQPEQKQEAMDWEVYVDRYLGPHVRRICYQSLLYHPQIVIPFFAHKGPWYSKLYLHGAYRQLSQSMRKLMDINPESASKSRAMVDSVLNKLGETLGQGKYLVGERFTRADLATAALLGPLIQPPGYDLPWPEELPEELDAIILAWKPKLATAEHWYLAHRSA